MAKKDNRHHNIAWKLSTRSAASICQQALEDIAALASSQTVPNAAVEMMAQIAFNALDKIGREEEE